MGIRDSTAVAGNKGKDTFADTSEIIASLSTVSCRASRPLQRRRHVHLLDACPQLERLILGDGFASLSFCARLLILAPHVVRALRCPLGHSFCVADGSC